MRTIDSFRWVGWEYEDRAGIHLIMSSRHILLDGRTLACGTKIPSWVTPSSLQGDQACRRCYKIGTRIIAEARASGTL